MADSDIVLDGAAINDPTTIADVGNIVVSPIVSGCGMVSAHSAARCIGAAMFDDVPLAEAVGTACSDDRINDSSTVAEAGNIIVSPIASGGAMVDAANDAGGIGVTTNLLGDAPTDLRTDHSLGPT